MVHITRRERFSAAHRLYRPDWTDEDNENIFGKCSNPNWHGHNFVLFVTIKGDIDQETGLLVNLKLVSKVIRERIIDKVDHKNLNTEVDFMKDKITSSECLAQAIWDELKAPIDLLGVQLHKIKLEETENNYVEYYG